MNAGNAAEGGAAKAGPRLVDCYFLVPVRRNSDQKLHSRLLWRDLRQALRCSFRGSSGPRRIFAFREVELMPGEWVEGQTGKVIEDESRKYHVAVPEDQVEQLRALLRKVANTFDQECIFLSVAGIVEYVERRPEEGFLEG